MRRLLRQPCRLSLAQPARLLVLSLLSACLRALSPEQRPRSQGHCLAAAAGRLGIEPTVVMPVRTPLARRSAIARAGAKVIIHSDSADQTYRSFHQTYDHDCAHQVIIHGDGLADSKAEAERLARESSGELTLLLPHDDPRVIAGQAISSRH